MTFQAVTKDWIDTESKKNLSHVFYIKKSEHLPKIGMTSSTEHNGGVRVCGAGSLIFLNGNKIGSKFGKVSSSDLLVESSGKCAKIYQQPSITWL